jgi:hypothetical protein
MRINMPFRPIAAAAVVVGALAMSSSAAQAVTPTGAYADFKNCPYTNTAVLSCLVSPNTSGTIKLGNAVVPIAPKTVTLQGGFTVGDTGTTWYNAVGADTLSKTPLKVPGGLIGLVSTGGWSGWLIDLFNAAVAAGNDVYATAELAGPVQFNYINLLLELNGPAVTLPIKVKLENPFLGSGCYIGSNSNPITLQLTTGTTSPPPGVTPLVGSRGTLSSTPDGYIVTAAGAKLVDNTFAAPAATNCGNTFLDKPLVTLGVNLKEGLPAAAGVNSATMQGTSKIADRTQVQASAH